MQRGEVIEPVPVALREPGVVAILSTPHKSGKTHYTKVGADALLSARALLEGQRGLSVQRYDRTVREACVTLRLKPLSPAWMRHTAATHAVQQPGVSDSDTGKFLGHADASMVHKVYGVLRTPPKVPTILDDAAPAAQDATAALVEEVRQLRREVAQLRKERRRGGSRA